MCEARLVKNAPPVVLVLVGLPGSGKSTLAYALAGALAWPVINKDVLKSALLADGLEEPQAAALSYRLLWDLTRDVLVAQRRSVIVDAVAGLEVDFAKAAQITAEVGGVLRVIACDANDALRDARLRRRDGLISQPASLDPNNPRVMDRSLYVPHLPAGSLLLETSGSLKDALRQALGYLQAPPSADP